MDWRGETFLFQSDLGFPSLLEQGATLAGATPTLPDYDMATGLLSETAPAAFPNSDEYSLFDLSGATSLIANYSGGSLDSSSRIAIGVPSGDMIPPIPAPATLPLLLGAVAVFGAITGRRRAAPRA